MTEHNKQNDTTQDSFLITPKKFGNKHRIISDSSDEEINIEPTPLKESVSFFMINNLYKLLILIFSKFLGDRVRPHKRLVIN